MKVSIFQKLSGNTYKRIEVEVVRFKERSITFQFEKKMIRAILANSNEPLLTFFDLLTDDLLHCFVEDDDFTSLVPMPYILSTLSPNNREFLEYRQNITELDKIYRKQYSAIDNTIENLVESFTAKNSLRNKYILELFLQGITRAPSLLHEFNETFTDINGGA